MIRALYTAATGMQAQQLNIDVIANNLANVNTAGFKKSRADFQDLLYQTLRAPGSPTTNNTQSPTGIQVGLGARPTAVQRINVQGDYNQTGNALDVAIEGTGFFQMTLPTKICPISNLRPPQCRKHFPWRKEQTRYRIPSRSHAIPSFPRCVDNVRVLSETRNQYLRARRL